jgi:predicted amidohydrolase YtcJ
MRATRPPCFSILGAPLALLPLLALTPLFGACTGKREAMAPQTQDDAGSDEQAARARPEPHADIAVGARLTAYVGPRFLTGEAFVPEARTVIADETGRVRALLKGEPPADSYPIVTLPGALAVPGLHDAHIHVQGLGESRDQVQLLGSSSAADARRRVTAWADAHPDAAAVRGRGWDQSLFQGGTWPTARDLEGADARGRPILLARVDGHAAWADRKMLALAGISSQTPDPPGGRILRDAAGEPTGILIDHAIDLATAKLPSPSQVDIERWLVAGMTACADAGLVAAHDMGMSVEAAKILMRLDSRARERGGSGLPIRVFVYLDGTDPDALALLGTHAPTDTLRLMGIKLYADGAMGSRGAALLDDYADDPGNRGLLLTEPAVLQARIAGVRQKGYAAAVHAIGDRANRIVLDAMSAAPPARSAARDRVEHAQLVAPQDFARFRTQGLVASMQPTHATSDMRWAEARVGAERVKGAYAWRTMLASGAPLAFGSDAPVEDERPQLGIYAAITRQDADGAPPGGFLPDERLTQDEALAAFAAGAAYAVGLEQHLGALTPGMFFDVSLFADDAAAAAAAGDPKAWLKTRPAGIVVGGVLRPVGAEGKN